MAKFLVKLLLVVVLVTQVFGGIFAMVPIRQAEAVGSTMPMPAATAAVSVPQWDWHAFLDNIFKGMMMGMAHTIAQNFMQRFVDRLTEKYKIRNFLYYDQVLSNYYLTNFIRDKISDPDLRKIYVLMESEFIYGQPNGTTPGSSGIDRSRAIYPRLRLAITDLYKKQTGVDPALIANPPKNMSNRDYLAQSQYFYFNHPGYTESALRGSFGAYQSAATTAAQLEVLVGNSLKAGRFVGGHCNLIASPGAAETSDTQINTPQLCAASGGTWQASALDEARSFIDNPTGYVDKWMFSVVNQMSDSNLDPKNFWFVIGNTFGKFLANRLFLDKATGVLSEDPRGYTPDGSLGQGSAANLPVAVDVDGDGTPDGYDIDSDGQPDNCIYGGTAPDCTPSSEALAPSTPGSCSEVHMPDKYGDDLQAAQDEVDSTNPNGVADAFNTSENAIAYLDEVAKVLQGEGLNATTDVLNGNGNQNRGDLIAIWGDEEIFAERYDAVVDVGAGNTPMRQAATVNYVGHVSLASCVNQ